MKKPMKKYVNGVLNKSYISYNKTSSIKGRDSYEDLTSIITKKADEKKIHDSKLDNFKEKTERDLREDKNKKIEKAKELLGIKETSNKKKDTLDNYKLEYRKRHEIRDFKEEIISNETKVNYNDIFRDI